MDNEGIVIIICSHDNNLYALDDKGNTLWEYATKGKIFSNAIIADVNHDNKHEVLVGSCDDKLHVVSYRGTRMWDYETNFWVVAAPLVFDLNNNKEIKIAVGSYDGFVYLLEGEADFVLDYMPGISSITQQSGHYFDVITKEPGKYYGKLLCKYNAGGTITGMTALANKENGLLVTTNTKKLDKLIYS